ncbi:MAG: SMI1/KNR4 family protein [Lachnospiraceae bacterium]|nr:SMI1/KNR4 family protein [Lachnospiraceae bacterium]
MSLETFILNHNVDRGRDLIDSDFLKKAENEVEVKFGNELKQYLLTYGYLGYGYAELYGMNLRMGLNSDMVKQTLYLHKYYPVTAQYVALENQGDGDYYLVDSNDRVFEFETGEAQLRETGWSLFEYIEQRFEGVEKNLSESAVL